MQSDTESDVPSTSLRGDDQHRLWAASSFVPSNSSHLADVALARCVAASWMIVPLSEIVLACVRFPVFAKHFVETVGPPIKRAPRPNRVWRRGQRLTDDGSTRPNVAPD